jgi:hypothetical protein
LATTDIARSSIAAIVCLGFFKEWAKLKGAGRLLMDCKQPAFKPNEEKAGRRESGSSSCSAAISGRANQTQASGQRSSAVSTQRRVISTMGRSLTIRVDGLRISIRWIIWIIG